MLRARRILAMAIVWGLAVPGVAGSQDSPRDSVRPVAGTPPARGVIDGVVTDDDLGRIGAADISILNSPVRFATSEEGRFRITDVAPGPYVVVVRKLGFQPLAAIVHVAANDTARLTFSLQRLAVGLDTVRITETARSGKMEEFERRRKSGLGYYITTQDIARWHSYDLGNVLRRFPGISIKRNTDTGVMNVETARWMGMLSSCPMRTVVDGVPMPTGMGIDMLPPLADIAGVEIHKSLAGVPLQYSIGGAPCGAVLIWTKSGR
jgi:hypothetical protein